MQNPWTYILQLPTPHLIFQPSTTQRFNPARNTGEMAKLADGIAFIAMASFWAINYPFVKIALQYEPPMMVLLFRVLFALVFSFAIFFRSMKIPLDLKTHLKIFGFSLLNITIFMGLWFTGEETVSASLSSLIIYSYPYFCHFLCHPWSSWSTQTCPSWCETALDSWE